MINNIIMDLIFPRRCALCDEVLKFGKKYICSDCKKDMAYIKEPICLKCGKTITNEKEYCIDCIRRRHLFIQGQAVFDYGSIAGSLHRFKNKGRREYAQFYARSIYYRKKQWLDMISPDAFIPVPIHLSKLRQRGYNQAKLVSDELSLLSGIPTMTNLVYRVKKTNPLKNLSVLERQKNLKKAFKVAKIDVKLDTIVIIDDIYTSGSTIDEISKAILECYNCKIYFITITIGRGI